MKKKLLISVLIIFFYSNISFASTSPRIILSNEDNSNLIIVETYKIKNLVSGNKDKSGVLVEILKAIVKEEGKETIVNIRPIKSIAKYYFFQGGVAAALGTKNYLGEKESSELIELILFVIQGKEYGLYFNPKHPNSKSLSKIAKINLSKLKECGIYDQILKKYNF